jgi:hypothetical protein
MMARRYNVAVRRFGTFSVWAETRHKAKAQVATDLVDRGFAYDFKQACNEWIYSCRLAPD